MPTFRIRSLVAAVLASVMATLIWTNAAAAAEQLDVIATSAKNGPIALTAGPIGVALTPPAGAGASIGERVASAVKSSRALHLMLTGLRANVQPETLYQVYLGLPSGAAPTPDSANFVGTFNFFNAAIGEAAIGAGDRSRFFGYDVTDLARSLHARKLLGDAVSVTIVPAGPPNPAARPIVGEVALVLD